MLTPERRGRWLLFAALVVVIVVVDQLVKRWIVANFEVGAPVQIAGDWIRIVLGHNTGGLFGFFQDQARVFALLSLLVIGLIVGYEAFAGVDSLFLTLALGLLLGGAIGNFIDRLSLGYVRDFVDMGIGSWRWYTFNVADAAISTSIVLLFALAILPQRGSGRKVADGPEGDRADGPASSASEGSASTGAPPAGAPGPE